MFNSFRKMFKFMKKENHFNENYRNNYKKFWINDIKNYTP